MDLISRRLFEEQLPDSKSIPTLDMITKFLEQRYQVLMAARILGGDDSENGLYRNFQRSRQGPPRNRDQRTAFSSSQKGNETPSGENGSKIRDDKKEGKGERKLECVRCKGPHYLRQCEIFKGLKAEDRLKFVMDERLCFRTAFL